MKELIKALLTTSTERIKNPFISTYIFAWVAINWRPILYLIFFDANILRKISYIDKHFISIKNQLIIPLSFTIIYIVILPYLMWLFEFLSKIAIKNRKDNQRNQKIYDLQSSQKIAEEESILENIKANYREKADLNKQIGSLNEQIEKLNSRIESKDQEILDLNDILQQASSPSIMELTEDTPDKGKTIVEEAKLETEYNSFIKSDLFPYFENIATSISSHNSIPKNTPSLVRDKYKYTEIIEENYDEERQSVNYNFTQKGLSFYKLFLRQTNVEPPIIEKDDLPF